MLGLCWLLVLLLNGVQVCKTDSCKARTTYVKARGVCSSSTSNLHPGDTWCATVFHHTLQHVQLDFHTCRNTVKPQTPGLFVGTRGFPGRVSWVWGWVCVCKALHGVCTSPSGHTAVVCAGGRSGRGVWAVNAGCVFAAGRREKWWPLEGAVLSRQLSHAGRGVGGALSQLCGVGKWKTLCISFFCHPEAAQKNPALPPKECKIQNRRKKIKPGQCPFSGCLSHLPVAWIPFPDQAPLMWSLYLELTFTWKTQTESNLEKKPLGEKSTVLLEQTQEKSGILS